MVVAVACSTNDEGAVVRARIAEGCTINSDCAAPFVCAFRACHEQCRSSRDCQAGVRCVQAEKPLSVCQLPQEQRCARNSQCPEPQLCGQDGQCRDACATDRDCLEDQTCVLNTCADRAELVDGGLLDTVASDGGAQECVHSTDCPGALVCLRGSCNIECSTDKDCFVSWTCRDTRCTPPGDAK